MSDEQREAALRWLRSYHGSIDSTALVLAHQAGQRHALGVVERVKAEAKAEQREADAQIAESRYFGNDQVAAANRWGAKQAAAAIRAAAENGESK